MVKKTVGTKLDDEGSIYQTIKGIQKAENMNQAKATRFLLNKGVNILHKEKMDALLLELRNAVYHVPPQIEITDIIKDSNASIKTVKFSAEGKILEMMKSHSVFFNTTVEQTFEDILQVVL